MKIMIAQEVVDFKRKISAGQSDSLSLPSVPKPSAPLPGPTRSPTDGFNQRDDHDENQAMDIDEELRMKGHA